VETRAGEERTVAAKPAKPARTHRRLLAGLLVLVAVAVAVVWSPSSSGHPLEVAAVAEAGTIPQSHDWFRDGGQSALVGGRILWVFGDTLFRTADEEGSHLRSNTSARSDPDDPFRLDDPVTDQGLPVQFVPFDDLEAEYNHLSGRPDDRIAVWPTSVLAMPDGSAVVFYREVKVSPGALNLDVLASGVATVAPGAVTAVRDPGLLFSEPDPVFSAGAALADGQVYLYGCARIEGPRFGCRVARAPLAGIHDRSAYEFWDGTEWTDDAGRAVFVLDGPSGGPSVSWNPWLEKYLAVYTLGLTNRVMMRTADRPEGPWSEPVEAFVGAPTEGAFNYAAFEHPELAREDGRVVTITYFHPLGGFRGEFRIVRVRFA